jgi:hypothetical protein
MVAPGACRARGCVVDARMIGRSPCRCRGYSMIEVDKSRVSQAALQCLFDLEAVIGHDASELTGSKGHAAVTTIWHTSFACSGAKVTTAACECRYGWQWTCTMCCRPSARAINANAINGIFERPLQAAMARAHPAVQP